MNATRVLDEVRHIAQNEFLGVGDMRGAYSRAHLIPTSSNADAFLIRSHIAYHIGSKAADSAAITPSRGHSYRVNFRHGELIVRITDHYDHRAGVVGIV